MVYQFRFTFRKDQSESKAILVQNMWRLSNNIFLDNELQFWVISDSRSGWTNFFRHLGY
jgi:hypothetical protein